MIDAFFLFFESHFVPLGSLGVFLASIIEEVIAPIPSALILLGSGALFLPPGPLSFEILFLSIVLPAALGITLGSLVIYGIAHMIGEAFINRFGKFFGLSMSGVHAVVEKFRRGSRDEITLFTLRAVPIIPSVVISASAGLLHIPIRTYVAMTFLGTIPRACALALIGWKAGEAYHAYAERISHYENTILILTFLTALAWIIFKYLKQRKKTVIL